MKTTIDYRKIQGVNPVPSMRRYKTAQRAVSRQLFFDVFVTPNDGTDDHLLFTIRANDNANACAIARGRLMGSAKWHYFDFSTIRAVEAL